MNAHSDIRRRSFVDNIRLFECIVIQVYWFVTFYIVCFSENLLLFSNIFNTTELFGDEN